MHYKHNTFAIIRLLLQHGADIHVKTLDNSFVSHIVIQNTDINEFELLKLLKLFIRFKIDLNAQDINGDTILIMCVRYKIKKLLKFLLKNKVDIHLRRICCLYTICYKIRMIKI